VTEIYEYLQEEDYTIRILAEFISNAFLSSWFNGEK
jgi:hypothetical protein